MSPGPYRLAPPPEHPQAQGPHISLARRKWRALGWVGWEIVAIGILSLSGMSGLIVHSISNQANRNTRCAAAAGAGYVYRVV